MSLAIDSLVTDLIFQSGDGLDPEVLVEVLGGQEALAKKQVIDPDMQDARFEMELSPSMPFRQRGERRLMLIDDSVAPMRADPQGEKIIPIDLRSARDELIKVCSAVPIRVGRLFALGSWGDAVWVVRSFVDLRGLCLISWALDPSMDIAGRRRASPLGQGEFEEKLIAYAKRLEELDEEQIRESLSGVSVEERDDGLIIIDMLEEDGTWDQEKSLVTEAKVAAIASFSHFPGAKSKPAGAAPDKQETQSEADVREEPEAPAALERELPPIVSKKLGESLLMVFPLERFDLEVAGKLGKGDWDSIVAARDNIDGPTKDILYRDGANFIAPIEFFSEVFIGGKPLSKRQFESDAKSLQGEHCGTKIIEGHFPRFGPVLLIAQENGNRLITSLLHDTEQLLVALR